MTDRAQFEAMLEALINDDQAAAKEIFHNIVVGKSREIYEELLAEDFSQDSGNPYAKKEEEESMEEESMEEEGAEEEESAEEEKDDAEDSEEDSEDDAEDDGEEDPFADSEEDGEEGEGDIEDRVMDLEDALEDLKAEFEQLMASEEEEGHDDLGGDFAAEPEMSAEPEMGMDHEGDIDELASLMEYVNKVNVPSGGDNGVNNKSAVAGKNDMGGTTANMTKSFSTTTGGTEGGLAGTKTQPQDAGNVNVPGAKNATKLKPVTAGHGAEKAGKKETADNKQSFLKQAKK
jgi:hypothetical protein